MTITPRLAHQVHPRNSQGTASWRPQTSLNFKVASGHNSFVTGRPGSSGWIGHSIYCKYAFAGSLALGKNRTSMFLSFGWHAGRRTVRSPRAPQNKGTPLERGAPHGTVFCLGPAAERLRRWAARARSSAIYRHFHPHYRSSPTFHPHTTLHALFAYDNVGKW